MYLFFFVFCKRLENEMKKNSGSAEVSGGRRNMETAKLLSLNM